MRGGLKQVAELYHATCAKYGNKPGRLMCSYFTHFADNKAQEDAQRARQIRYYKECVIAAFPGDPATAPPSYRYFIEIVDRLTKVRPAGNTGYWATGEGRRGGADAARRENGAGREKHGSGKPHRLLPPFRCQFWGRCGEEAQAPAPN